MKKQSNNTKKETGLALFKSQVEKAKSKFISSFPENKNMGEKVFEREKGFAVMAAMENKELALCSPASIYSSVASVALTGLTLNPTLELAYLIPRRGRCCLDVGYKGMNEVLTQSKKINDIRAKAVFENDKFDYNEGTGKNYYLRHKPRLNRPADEKIIAAYSIATFPNGTERFFLMDYNTIMKRKAIAPYKDVWNKWEEEQCIKTVIRAHYKYLPKTERATQIMQLSDEANPVDFEKEKKEDTEKQFEEADIIDEKKEIEEAMENIIKSKTINELEATIDCYPDLVDNKDLKKVIDKKVKEFEKTKNPKPDKETKKVNEPQFEDKEAEKEKNGKLNM